MGACLALAAALWLPACTEPRGSGTAPAQSTRPVGAWFTDIASDSGIDFVHVNGMTGDFYYPEVIAPGVALLDYDLDGDLDAFFVQGGALGPADGEGGTNAGAARPPGSRLFRNDMQVEPGRATTLRFTDVTDAAGIESPEYGMGVAAGDYDNDGCVDLYVTALGTNRLLRNRCDGTFADDTERSGTGDRGWSVPAAFFDFDRDGWLDLYVGHYLQWSAAINTPCFAASGRRVYCAPQVYRAEQSRLYRNNRDGTFTDVTLAAGLAAQFGPALGLSTADFNGDGWIDLYVANDGEENQLWMNQHDGTFINSGPLSGTALGPTGQAKAGMGTDAADVDDDGDEDLVVANLTGEGLDLYVNDGSGVFENRGAHAGIGHLSLPHTGFGAAWFDADNDGRLDLATVNGAVQTIEAQVRAGDPFPLRQPKQLFRNLGGGRFEDVTANGGPAFETLRVGRGAAFGDIDNDGDVDILVGNNNGPGELLRNDAANGHHWLGLRILRRNGKSDALGARVAIARKGEPTRWRRVHVDGSYASSSDPRVIVGLGSSAEPPDVRVIWPDGHTQEWPRVAVDTYTTLTRDDAEP